MRAPSLFTCADRKIPIFFDSDGVFIFRWCGFWNVFSVKGMQRDEARPVVHHAGAFTSQEAARTEALRIKEAQRG